MNDVLELELTGVAYGGDAIARYEHRLIFVPYALPQEKVRIELVEVHRRWARGRLLEILQPSPERITPSCPHFGPERCGGCQWQHVSAETQAGYKRQLLQEQFAQVEGFSPAQVHPTLQPSSSWAYCSQSVYYPSGSDSLGLPQAQGSAIYPLDFCPLQHPALAELYAQFNLEWDGLREVDMGVGLSSEQGLVVLRTRKDEIPEIETDVPLSIALRRRSGSIFPLIGDPWYFEVIRGQEYRLSAGSTRPFNIAATEALLDQVVAYLDPSPGQVMIDVYCGYGLFTRGFADQVSVMMGVDEDTLAIEDCAFNCHHLDNVSLSEGPPSRVLRLFKGYADIAVVSPPKTGVGHRIAQNLARMGVKRVAYVAPHPNTLLRDLPSFQQAHYILSEITPIDLAPQTAEVLAVALFTR